MSEIQLWKLIDIYLFPIRSCSQKVYISLTDAKYKKVKSLKRLRRFFSRFFEPIVIKGIKEIYRGVFLEYERITENKLNTQYIMDYSRCLQLWKRIQNELYTNLIGNEEHSFNETRSVYRRLYHCLERFLDGTDMYIKRIYEEYPKIYNLLGVSLQKYYDGNKTILMPIMYYDYYITRDLRKKFLRTFGILRRVLFWIHHCVVYRYKYIKLLRDIQLG
jgi:hypothetical protein